jgi:hypothetical protein
MLSVLKKEYGEEFVFNLVMYCMLDVCAYFNVGKSMDEYQIQATARLIIRNMWWLNPSDFKLCFDMAKMGKYGKAYDRIDGAVIFEWLNAYDAQREPQKQAIAEENRIEAEKVMKSEPIIVKGKIIGFKENNINSLLSDPGIKKIVENCDKQAEKDCEFRKVQLEYFKKQQENNQKQP